MAKIGKGHFRFDNHWGDYDIFYSSKDKQFYADANKLFEGSAEFFDSLQDKKPEGMNMYQIHHGRQNGLKQIWAVTQKDLEDAVSRFNRMFVETTTSEVKVILYSLKYKTETQNNETRGMRANELATQEFNMGFKYRIAMKKTLGDNSLYTDAKGYGRRLDRYDVADMKEIAWTQELEDFIVSFSKAFDGLIDKMKPFFETEGRIMELIGRNILPQ